MSLITRPRGGLPGVREKLAAREPVTVVAFGSSMTVDGFFLSHVVSTLNDRIPHANIVLHNNGRNGFDTVLAAFDAQSVAALKPDLVLLEFTINDRSPAILPLIVPALLGIMGQILEKSPACEFLFVYLAVLSEAAGGESLPIRIHDITADVLGVPSIDLAFLSAQLIASGDVTYMGEDDQALTRDGVHYNPIAGRLIGIPFARELADIIAGSSGIALFRELPTLADAAAAVVARSHGMLDGVVSSTVTFDGSIFGSIFQDKFGIEPSGTELVPRRTGVRGTDSESIFYRARRTSPKFSALGTWGLGDTNERLAVDFGRPLLVSADGGSSLRFEKSGSFSCFVGLANGKHVRVRVDGEETVLRPTVIGGEQRTPWPMAMTDCLPDRRHVIEIMPDEGMIFSDVYYIEPTLSPANAQP